jgi:Flp pilus assembly pilin Flp
MKHFFRDEEGQVLVDYLLTLALIVSVVLALGKTLRPSLYRLWQTLAQEIAAACPSCPKDPTIRLVGR